MMATSRAGSDMKFPCCYLGKLSPDHLCARGLQRPHQFLRPLPDVRDTVVGAKQLRTKAETRSSGRQPARNVLSSDTPHRKYADVNRKHGPQRFQVAWSVGHRGKQLQLL